MKRLILILFLFVTFYTPSQAGEYYEIAGIYILVPEDEAKQEYHYIEYDDLFYIKTKLDMEQVQITIIDIINNRLYKVKSNHNNEIYYILLQYPTLLFKYDEGEILPNYLGIKLLIY